MLNKELFWIFSAGNYEAQGNFSIDDVKQIAINYDPEFCEAPVWVGHDTKEPEALGWIEGLICEDDGKLYAWFSHISDDLYSLIQNKKFKRVSVELIKMDGKAGWYLYALALTNRPQIKNLKPMAFTAGDVHAGLHSEIQFSGEANKLKINIPINFSFKEKSIYFNNQNSKNNMDIKELKTFCTEHKIDTEGKSDAEILKAVNTFVTDIEAKVVKFSDQTKTLEDKIKEFEAKEILQIVDLGIAEKKLVPAQKDSMVSFGAKHGADELKSFIAGLPAQTLFENNVVNKSTPSAPGDESKEKPKVESYEDFLAKTKANPKFADNFTNEEILALRKKDFSDKTPTIREIK